MNAGRLPREPGELNELAEKRIQVIDPKENAVQELEKAVEEKEFGALVDGFLGMQAKLPLRDPLPEILQWINQCEKIAVRAAVDLPTGVTAEGTENPLRADFTIALESSNSQYLSIQMRSGWGDCVI